MKRIIESQASKSGVFSIREELCHYYEKNRDFCTIGQGVCMHHGVSKDCKMLDYYQEKLNGVRPKTFRERYPDVLKQKKVSFGEESDEEEWTNDLGG